MVLGIDNRTENWKTAYEFAPFFRDAEARKRLVGRLDETDYAEADDIHFELFWKGTRDYLHAESNGEKGKSRERLLMYCRDMLPELRDRVVSSKRFQELKDDNYALPTPESDSKLLSNLSNTEIDIVIETPRSLFIGEAKQEESFEARSGHVLVHQLIRQYVMAKALLKAMGCSRTVVPFVVGDPVDQLKRQQVKFMISQRWMNERNVLSWEDVKI
ncbi:MAG: hypothetical protein OXD31_07275 [Chloroflexi bacterium]|nr:hypothetical protein [Chloroflexota bacterium]